MSESRGATDDATHDMTHDGHGVEVVGPRSSDVPWSIAAFATLAAGWYLLTTGRASASAAILLLVGGLAASGVALGGHRFGPATEGSLDLSARLGLGLLGGALGGLVVLLVRWLLVRLGIPAALGVTMTVSGSGPETLGHLAGAAVWGMALGVLYPRIPGLGGASRGAWFSLLPSLYLLLKVYPMDRGAGLFGVGLGALTFAFVIGLNLLWGALAGATIGWGATSNEAPVARPLADPGRDRDR